MLGIAYDRFLILIPAILNLLVTILPLLLVGVTISKIKKEKYLIDMKYKAVAVNLKVTNYEVANQKKKLKTLEEDIVNLTSRIKKLG